MHENEPRHNETWSERTDILPIPWSFILGQCKRAKKAGERWKSVQVKENGRKGKTWKRLYKHLSQPTSRRTASHVRMANVKMSKFAVLEAFTRSPTFFFVSACAKPRRDCNNNVVSKVNLCSSKSLWRLFLPTYFVKWRRTPLKLNSKGPYRRSGREIKFRIVACWLVQKYAKLGINTW